jgi:outer membrane immunogenic protein
LPAESEVANFFTLRARGGYLITPTTLAFVSGGVALATLKYGNSGVQTGQSVEPGVTVGTGVEVQAFQNWTVKGEYLFMAFGGAEACGFFVCLPNLNSDFMHVHVFRLALNRYF